MSSTAHAILPTIDYTPAQGSRPWGKYGADVSVSLAPSTVDRFSEETAQVLRNRLKAASLIMAAALTVSLASSFFLAQPLYLSLRTTVLAVMVGAYLILWRGRAFQLRNLRFIELAIFGAIVMQVSAMLWLTLGRFAETHDYVTAIGAENVYLAEFSILILVYGMLMPNTWKRAFAVLFPVACVPYFVILMSQWKSEQVARALEADHFGMALPLPFVSAVAAVYGTSIINSARRDAFRARQFGQYRLKQLIGSGGMGEVYLAEHYLLKRPCAIKLIKQNRTDAAALARFETEVQSTAKLTHWNAVEIFDYGHTDNGMFYYVMEYLDGMNLEDLVNEHGPMSAGRAVHLLRQICNALKEAHGLGLVHRDLKPANIFAARLGGICDVAKLLDFGLVRPGNGGWQTQRTYLQEGRLAGSPLYMPPEQIVDFDQVDGRGDIYSLGAVAYFLLTGVPPFVSRNPIEVLLAHANEPVVPPSKILQGLPADLEAIVLRCLEKKPEDRFQDVESLGRALAECASANEWTELMAAEWWRDHTAQMKQPSIED